MKAAGILTTTQEALVAPAKVEVESSATFQQGGALAAMRAIQQVQQFQARSNGTIQQSQADTAVAHLMQQAQQNGAYSMQPPAVDKPSPIVKQEPDLPTSINPSETVITNGKKRTLSGVDHSRPKKSKTPRNDIDLDNEAINSDLDDSDDDALRAEGDDTDDADIQTVLCLYDKVQRTKNKWKCVLKDGIVNIGGRDFAFTKANGEFEW